MIRKLSYIFSGREKRKIFLILLLTILGSFMELLGVTAFLPFTEMIMDPESVHENRLLEWVYQRFDFSGTLNFLAAMAFGIILLYIVKNLYLAWHKNYLYRFSFGMQRDISVRLLKAYMKEPYTFHLGKNVAELQRSLQDDTDLFSKLIINTMELITELVVCLLLGIYLFIVSKSITIVVLLILAFSVVLFTSIAKKVSTTLGRQNQENKSRIYQWIHQSLGGIKEVKILGRERFFEDAFERSFDKYVKGVCTQRILGELPRYVIEATCMTGLLGAVILKLYFGQKDLDDFIPQLAVFGVAAFRLLPSVGRINSHVNNILYCSPSLDQVYNDLKSIEDLPMTGGEADPDWDLTQRLSVEHVRYSYPGQDTPVIEDASFVIEKGTTVAFVGSSGAGKTTMADIILGLLTPQEGHLRADGMDVFRNVPTWQRRIGYVPQVIYLSDDTIRGNIAFGIRPEDVSEEAVIQAAKKAQLWDFIERQPDGLDTKVGERGVRLSGGQRQRIGIARALYHDPEVLVLDEATSALDQETETAVMQAVDSLHGTKTILLIAHRLSTIQGADRIYEVVDGQVLPRTREEVLGVLAEPAEDDASGDNAGEDRTGGDIE